jgi:hypothetical protein
MQEENIVLVLFVRFLSQLCDLVVLAICLCIHAITEAFTRHAQLEV